MCQLTLVNLRNPVMNCIVSYTASFINSTHGAPHGIGFFQTDSKIWKTEVSAHTLFNLGGIMSTKILNDKPVICHVRLASRGIKLDRENNHPFETKWFVGAHNGTLYLKEERTTYYNSEPDASRDSDSKRFFDMLDAEYETNGNNFVNAIKTTMEKHKGKFAFLIYEKKTGIYYAIRGKTADLYLLYIYKGLPTSTPHPVGYIINTDKDDLLKIAMQSINLFGIVGMGSSYHYGEVIELKKEMIFKCENLNVIELEEVKETPQWENLAQSGPNFAVTVAHRLNTGNFSGEDIKVKTLKFQIVGITDFMYRHFLTPADMDLLFEKLLGQSLASTDEENINIFFRYCIEKLSANKRLRKYISGAGLKRIPTIFYTEYGLEYPWMLNKRELIIDAVNKYLKTDAAQKNSDKRIL